MKVLVVREDETTSGPLDYSSADLWGRFSSFFQLVSAPAKMSSGPDTHFGTDRAEEGTTLHRSCDEWIWRQTRLGTGHGSVGGRSWIDGIDCSYGSTRRKPEKATEVVETCADVPEGRKEWRGREKGRPFGKNGFRSRVD